MWLLSSGVTFMPTRCSGPLDGSHLPAIVGLDMLWVGEMPAAVAEVGERWKPLAAAWNAELWIFIWRERLPLVVKAALHTLHLYGFSPLWTRP